MAILDVEKIHSVSVDGNKLLVNLISGKALYQFTLSPTNASVLIKMIQSEAKNLPDTDEDTLIESKGIQPIVGPEMNPGLQFQLSDNLHLSILLGEGGLDALRACIDQLESGTKPEGRAH